MLFSNFLDNVPKFSEFANSLSIERCYQQLKWSPRSGNNHKTFGQGQSVTQVNHSLHHNQSRTRWKGRRHSDIRPNRLPHQKFAHQHQRTLTPHSMSAVILFFIVLLSHDQTTTVNGARSRDSFNSIYQNRSSVNNITNEDLNTSAAIDTNFVNLIDEELPIIDIEYFNNVTDDAEVEKLLGGRRKLKRLPIYQNEFAVYIPNGADMADYVAEKHGFSNMGQVSFVFIGNYLLCGYGNHNHSKSPI